MTNDKRDSILQMAKGAVQERVDYEVEKVINNILDVNTEATAARKVTLTIELKPDSERQVIAMKASAKTTLAPTKPVATALAITTGAKGEKIIAEMTPQIPGQLSMTGEEQPAPKLLKLANG